MYHQDEFGLQLQYQNIVMSNQYCVSSSYSSYHIVLYNFSSL